MVELEVAREAIKSKNFALATEIYQRAINKKGPATELLVGLGECLALSGRISQSFSVFVKAHRLGGVKPEDHHQLIAALVKLTKERMEAANNGVENRLLLDTKALLDSEPFFCGLCLGTTIEPTTIYCGHTFCRKCLSKTNHNACVVCGFNPPVAEYRPNILLTETVTKLFPRLNELVKLKEQANKEFAEGNLNGAVRLYSDILKIADNEHTVWSNRSYAHYRNGHFKDAHEDALRVIQLRPQWAKGYFRRAMAEEALGHVEQAAISYLKCLSLDQKAQQAEKNLSQILHNLLSPKEGAENLKHVPSMESEPVSQLMQGNTAVEDINEGIEKLKKLLDKQFQDCDTELHLGTDIEKVDNSNISIDAFECSLCYRLLHNPASTPCGHVFCLHCLNRSLDHSVDCPQCRSSLASYLALRNRSVTISLQKMLNLWWPTEVEERARMHEEDLASFSPMDNVADVPIFVCTIAFPTVLCPLHVYEPRYRLMMRQVMESGVRQFGMCMSTDDGSFSDYGTMLEIRDIKFFNDGRSVVDTVGGRRFRVMERGMRDGYHTAKVEFLSEAQVDNDELEELKSLHDTTHNKVMKWLGSLPDRIKSRIAQHFGEMPERDPDIQSGRLGPKWVWWVTAILPIDQRAQLAILGMNSSKDRLSAIDRVLTYLLDRKR